jgi:surfactin synthase thioesterase subunit
MPQSLIVAGRRAPHLADTDVPRHDCDEADLVAYLAENEGTPAEVLANTELLKMVLPGLRADLKLLNSHQFIDEQPLSCPILVYGGTTDAESDDGRLGAWRRHTTARFTLEMLPGGHFFVYSEQRRLLSSIAGELQRAVVDRPAPASSTNPRDCTGVTPMPVVSPSCGSNER